MYSSWIGCLWVEWRSGGEKIVIEFTISGAPETNRTSDLPLRRGLLYPLSYRGAESNTINQDFMVPKALF